MCWILLLSQPWFQHQLFPSQRSSDPGTTTRQRHSQKLSGLAEFQFIFLAFLLALEQNTLDSSKLWITFRKAPQSWVYFQIPRGFPPRDATSTPSPPKSNYSGIFLYKTPQQLCWMGANVGKCSLHRARIISSSLSHSDPSLDPTELSEC